MNDYQCVEQKSQMHKIIYSKHSKNSCKREYHSDTGLSQERGKTPNKQSSFLPKGTRTKSMNEAQN